MLNKETAINVAKTVQDPEVNVDIWTMGLIYNIDFKKPSKIDIKMTFTSPMCPYGQILVDELKQKLEKKGFKTVNIEIVFEPVWEPSKELRMLLGV